MASRRAYRVHRQMRLQQLSDEAGGPAELMRRTGVTDTHISACIKGRRDIGDDMASSLERGMNKPDGWLDTPPEPGVAHDLSLASSIILPTLSWEGLMTEQLPPVFRVTAPDDSMAPRVRVGQHVTVDTLLEPRPGDGVLIRDGDGHHYLRLYQLRRPGQWTAQPLNDAFQPLDSTADRLEVRGVVVGVEARWS